MTRLVEETVRFQKKQLKFIEFFDSIKKPFDLIDDIWNSLRNGVIPEKIVTLIAPFLISVVLGIIHFVEACHAAQDAYNAYMDKQLAHRKTRLYTNMLAFIFAGSGLGLSVTLFIGALSAIGVVGSVTLLGLVYYPFIIPTLLTSIYALKLYRVGYRFHQAKKAESESRNDPEKYEAAHKHRLMAERSVAFSTLEVLGSALVAVGITLGVLAVLGSASIASFGALPLGLLITGVCIGTLSNKFKEKNKKHNFKYTDKIRAFFIKDDTGNDKPLELKNDKTTTKIQHILLPSIKSEETTNTTSNESTNQPPIEVPIDTSNNNFKKNDSNVFTSENPETSSTFGLTR